MSKNKEQVFRQRLNELQKKFTKDEPFTEIKDLLNDIFSGFRGLSLSEIKEHIKELDSKFNDKVNDSDDLFLKIQNKQEAFKKELEKYNPQYFDSEVHNAQEQNLETVAFNPEKYFLIPKTVKAKVQKPLKIEIVKPKQEPVAGKFPEMVSKIASEIAEQHTDEVEIKQQVIPTIEKSEDAEKIISGPAKIENEASLEQPAPLISEQASMAPESASRPSKQEKKTVPVVSPIEAEEQKKAAKEQRFSRIQEYIEKDQQKGKTDVSL